MNLSSSTKNCQSHTWMWTVIKKLKKIALLLVLVYCFAAAYNFFRDNPEGTEYRSSDYFINPSDIQFLYDLTFRDTSGKRVCEQQIFDRIFSLIDNAEKYILIDMFLFNSYRGAEDKVHRRISNELVSHLVNKRNDNPEIKIDFITDPINTVYGGAQSRETDALTAAGINVIYTDLHKMRDSNIIYSPVWRIFFQWFGNSCGGFLPNPFSGSENDVSVRSYLELLNFKANHRKVFAADHDDTFKCVITSANPHDGSSAHSNVAFEITGEFYREIIKAERAVAEFSGSSLSFTDSDVKIKNETEPSKCSVSLVTENKIGKAILENINRSQQGDRIDMGMFYLSERDIIDGLLRASERNADIRIILDPNKDAFGREKNGIPNRQTARELIEKSQGKIKLRWYDTSGEQYHSKLTLIENMGFPSVVILGSANLTGRNLDNCNLETDVCFSAPENNETVDKVRQYFKMLWTSPGYTADYSKYEDDSVIKMYFARFLELSGASTF